MSETKLVQENVPISSPLSTVSQPVRQKQSTIPSIGVSLPWEYFFSNHRERSSDASHTRRSGQVAGTMWSLSDFMYIDRSVNILVLTKNVPRIIKNVVRLCLWNQFM